MQIHLEGRTSLANYGPVLKQFTALEELSLELCYPEIRSLDSGNFSKLR